MPVSITSFADAAAAPAPPAIESILVVDDYEDNRTALARRLQRHGYRVVTANGGAESLDLIGAQPFDLVLLDVMMPGISGLDVLTQLRKTHSATRLPIIMATAKDQSEDVVTAFKLGANDYVTKPLDFSVVLARVQTQLLLKRSVDQVIALEQKLTEQNIQLQAANAQLSQAALRTSKELAAAARVQKASLPKASPDIQGVRFSWVFEPCDELAGDSLNVLKLDERNVAFYVLDVSGHGVPASLMAVAATRLLSITGDGNSIVQDTGPDGTLIPTHPAEVAQRLTQRFTWDDNLEQYLTLFYALYDTATRMLRFVSAGHPSALRITSTGKATPLDGSDMPIGIGASYSDIAIKLDPGDRIYLYSDGVTESMNKSMEQFGPQRFQEAIASHRHLSLSDSIAQIVQAIAAWQQGAPSRDDVTILAMQVD